jgi:preprotein translocase subunit SecD
MKKYIIISSILLIVGGLLGNYLYVSEKSEDGKNFKYGLDLKGGIHLTYRADATNVPKSDIDGSMDSLRSVVEKRINIFNVSEPIVQVEKGGIFSDEKDANRLIVELPGIDNLEQAIKMIGETPILEFKLATKDPAVLERLSKITPETDQTEILELSNLAYISTGLTGADLKRASLVFDQNTGAPLVGLQFNEAGTKLFQEITRSNLGNVMAIFLDGEPISAPVIQSEIFGGEAQITGSFSIEEARDLVQSLNFGALPLPIELIETQTIGASLGEETLNKGISALIYGLIAISVFMILFYRLPGLVAVFALAFYVILMLFVFKSLPVVLTAAGIAGFILSLGMAVDANVLIFERIKEELNFGNNTYDAVQEGAKRAWLSIRDGNLSSLISAAVLYWLSDAAVVQGFALVFGIGILISMFTALTLSKTLLLSFSSKTNSPVRNFLFSNGLKK